MYKIIFYSTSSDKRSPIADFLNKAQEKLRVKILRQIQYVKEFGLNPSIPNIKKLTGTCLRELRILGRDNVRVLCANFSGKKVFVVNVFRKKEQKTPKREVDLALRRVNEMVDK